uniref:Uncharacterized protein n=2 Tax=Zea mays TaxID=4577 RepID=A0A804NVM2_MAIZE
MTWNSSSRTTALCECSTVRRPVADFLEREEEGIPHGRRRREQMGEGRDIGVPVEPNPTAGTTSLATAAASQMRRLNGECSAQRPKTAWNRSSDWDTNTDTAWNRSSDSDTDTAWNRSSDSDTDTLNDVIPFALMLEYQSVVEGRLQLKGKALNVKDGGVKKKKKKYQREESSQTESDKNGDEKNPHSDYDHLTRAERRYNGTEAEDRREEDGQSRKQVVQGPHAGLQPIPG